MIKKLTILSIFILSLCSVAFAANFTPRGDYNSGAHDYVSIDSPPVLEGRYKYGEDISTITPSNVVVYGDVYVVARERQLFAYSFKTEELLWQTTIPNSRALSNTIMLINNNVVVANERSIIAYDPYTGAQNWTYKAVDKIKGLPPFDSKYFYVLTNRLDLVSLTDGTSVQNMRVNNLTSAIPPVLRTNSFMVLATNGKMSRFENGVLKWNAALAKATLNFEAVANVDSVFIQSENTIYSLNVTSNNSPVRWELTRNDIFDSSNRRNIINAKMSTVPEFLTIVTSNGSLVRVDKSGKYIGSENGIQYLVPIIAAPTILKNCMLLRMESGHIGIINRNNELIWLFRLPTVDGNILLGEFFFAHDGAFYVAASDGYVYKFNANATDTKPPTIFSAFPSANYRLYSGTVGLSYVGAIIYDEGIGVDANSIFFTVDGARVNNPTEYNTKTGYYYAKLDEGALKPGEHVVEMSVSDRNGNNIIYKSEFYLGNKLTTEIVQIIIRNNKITPSTLSVKPGTIIEWINETSSNMVLSSDNITFSATTVAPKERAIFIVPEDVKLNTSYTYKINGTLEGNVTTVSPSSTPAGFPNIRSDSLPTFAIPSFLK